jgi:hypothetical protein
MKMVSALYELDEVEADETVLYDFTKPGYSSATGHFTQIVWKGTTKIGCAAASCADGTIFSGYKANSTYVVCESHHYSKRSRADEKASIRLLVTSLAATRLELSSCSLPTSVSRFRSRLLASYDHIYLCSCSCSLSAISVGRMVVMYPIYSCLL